MTYFGLTGGIACGKSTAARMFEELGAKIVEADRIGHELLRLSEPTGQEVARRFGPGILAPSGEIDRRRLAAIVFADAARLQALNAMLHPEIIRRVEEQAAALGRAHPRAVIIVDAALIFEAGIGGRFNKVIVAWCRPEQQLERLMSKARLTRREAEQRIAAQMPVEEKRRLADFVLDCSGSLDETRKQVSALYATLKKLAA